MNKSLLSVYIEDRLPNWSLFNDYIFTSHLL